MVDDPARGEPATADQMIANTITASAMAGDPSGTQLHAGDLRAAAVRYAAAGWPVFPCAPGEKEPLGELARHGCHDATIDPELIGLWWSWYPAANIGLATGAPGPDVVDVDTKHGAPGLASYARLRDAGLLTGAYAVVATPYGGWHLYYAGSGQHNSARKSHGIDFRGRGGYVLAPPSIVDGRQYRLVEHRPPTGVTVDWPAIRDFLDPPRPPRPRPDSDLGTTSRRSIAGLVRWLEARPAGDRNNALYWAARRALDDGAAADDLDQLREAIVRAGHDPAAADRTVRSALRQAGTAR